MVSKRWLPVASGRLFNLIFSPIAAGLCMSGIGRLRARRGQEVQRLDRFWYGYLFALGLSAVRFAWAA
jgi:hypothetical protein